MWHNDIKHIMITCNKYIYVSYVAYITINVYVTIDIC